MSSQKTEHYELNQWLATDQVLRTDFNADNAKIDGALNTLSSLAESKIGPMELITQSTLEESADALNQDLSSILWDQWNIVIVQLDLISGSSNMLNSVSIGLDVYSTMSWVEGNITPLAGPRTVVLFPMRDKTHLVRYLMFPGGSVGLSTETYEDLTKVSVSTNYAYGLRNGSKATVYGIR